MNALGGEWRNDLRIGCNLGVNSELYQPLDFRGRFFVAPSVEVIRSTFSFFESGRRIALFNIDQRGVALDLGSQFEDWGAFRVGVYRARVHAGVGAGEIDLPSGSIDAGVFRSSLSIIRTDSPTIPRHGSIMGVKCLRSRRSFGATDEYTKLTAGGDVIFSRGRQSFLIGARVDRISALACPSTTTSPSAVC